MPPGTRRRGKPPYAVAVSGPRTPPRRRRDRRGRGLRGPLLPAEVPAALSRAEQFDELVLAALARLTRRFPDELAEVEVVVDDIPPPGTDDVQLARGEPAADGDPARIVVHRRPVEARASGAREREELVHDVVVDAVAELLGVPPEDVDPEREDEGPH